MGKLLMTVNVLSVQGTKGCTNGGVSEGVSRLLIFADDDGRHEGVDLSYDQPPVLVVVPWYGYFRAVPAEPGKGRGPMFGGNYLDSSDGRWSNRFPHPVPIHDRFEAVETETAQTIRGYRVTVTTPANVDPADQARREREVVATVVGSIIRKRPEPCGHRGCTLRPGHIPGHTDR